MRKTHGILGVLCLALLLGLLLAAGPAGAVIGGTPDTENIYGNVGMNMEYGWPMSGHYGIAASCTLVRNDPGNVIVMCAAHQLAFANQAPSDPVHPNLVTFDPLPPMGEGGTFDAIASDPDEYVELGVYTVVDYAIHPGFDLAPYQGGSLLDGIGPTREDVGLMWLDRPVVDRETGVPMTPATIVGLQALDGVAVQGETFTLAGYGLNGWLQGNAVSATHSDKLAVLWSGRNYGDGSIVCTERAYLDRYLMLTSLLCDFDSGGALFHDGVIAAVGSFGTDGGHAPGYCYRLDTASAQGFLHDNGVPTLP